MGRALRAGVVLIVIGVVVSSWAGAVERELAGVRLGQKALDLLTKAGFGQPDYIGPLATFGEMAGPEGTGAETLAAPGAGQAGPTGPAGSTRGGRRAMGMGQAPGATGSLGMAAGPRLGVSLTGGMMGGAGRGMRAGRGAGAARGGARGAARGGGTARAGGAGRAGGAARTRAGAATAGLAGPGMYWYYHRIADVVLVLSLDRTGMVTAITLTGTFPYRGGRTSRGIGLSSTYMDIIAQYGYPDRTAIQGTAVQLTYVDHGVRFQLEGMKVREIAIGSYVTAGVEAAPGQAPESTTPAAGLSIEELRGYL